MSAILAVTLTILVVTFGIIAALIPNIIRLDRSIAGNFGVITYGLSLISLVFSFVLIFDRRVKRKVLGILLSLICIFAAIVGYVIFRWNT